MRNFVPCQPNFVVALSFIIIVYCGGTTSEAIMSQLAALFRSRAPWPTTFPSGGTGTAQSGEDDAPTDAQTSLFADMISNQINKNLQLQDFSHFNDLLTGQSINHLQNPSGVQMDPEGGGGGLSLQQLYPGAGSPILATSHPLPQLEIPHPNGSGKSIALIAHPVLGPNPNWTQPPEKGMGHKFHEMRTNPLNLLNGNAGLYSGTGGGGGQNPNQNPSPQQRPSAVRFQNSFTKNHPSGSGSGSGDRLKNSFQNFAQKLFFQNSQVQKPGPHLNMNIMNPNFHQPQKMIPIVGKPPPGGKIIAIPVPMPSNSPIWNNHFHGGRGGQTPQIIAVRQPFPPMTSVTSMTPTNTPQHVTSFMGMFNPSPQDLSSQAPSNHIVSVAPPTPTPTTPSVWFSSQSQSQNHSTTVALSPMPTTRFTFPTTTLPPFTQPSNYPYTDQIQEGSSGGGSKERYHAQMTSSSLPSSTTPTPTSTPSSTPPPPPSPSLHNNIQDVILHSSPSTKIHSPSPSSLVSSFRYPDPPTPPRMLNMNTRYEQSSENGNPSSFSSLKSQDQAAEWIPQTKPPPPPSETSTPTLKTAYFSPFKTGANHANGLSSVRKSKSNPKWKHEDSDSMASSSATTARTSSPHKSSFQNPDPSFKPSLQLHSFEDTTSGLREFITINPPKKKGRGSKSLFLPESTSTSASSTLTPKNFEEVDLPAMESGFRPFNHFAFVNGVKSASVSSTTESSMISLLRHEFAKDIITANVWSNMDPTEESKMQSQRQNRQFFSASGLIPNGYRDTKPFYAPAPASHAITVGASYRGQPGSSSGTTTTTTNYGRPSFGHSFNKQKTGSSEWVGKFSQSQFVPTAKTTTFKTPKHTTVSPPIPQSSSSELYEDWLLPTTKRKKENKDQDHGSGGSGATKSSKISSFSISAYTKGRYSSSKSKSQIPEECDKFHKFGFCPVTLHYPLDKVESIGSKCATLLTHLIAPLPKTDVRYDIIVPKNSTSGGGGSGKSTAWNWKTFSGRPVCDTKEVKIIPGWAKNEDGDWLVILQTEKWKQEAQISLCAQNSKHEEDSDWMMKCVQRFTAQRLVVLDPENEERCPVVRSVFLPSACVCLNDGEKGGGGGGKKGKGRNRHHSKNGQSQGHHESKAVAVAGTEKRLEPETSGGSKAISVGRSLFTSLFGLDLDPAQSKESRDEIIHPHSPRTEEEMDSKSDTNSEEDKNLNPSPNSPFIIKEYRPGHKKRSISGGDATARASSLHRSMDKDSNG